MFKIGDIVTYSTTGVCKITRIENATIGKINRDYYCLSAKGKNKSRVLVPCDNENLTKRMKPVLEKGEIEKMLNSPDSFCLEWCENDSERNDIFNNIIEKSDIKDYFKMLGCLYRQREILAENKKHLKSNDDSALRTAEKVIASVVSYLYSIDFDDAVIKTENAFKL